MTKNDSNSQTFKRSILDCPLGDCPSCGYCKEKDYDSFCMEYCQRTHSPYDATSFEDKTLKYRSMHKTTNKSVDHMMLHQTTQDIEACCSNPRCLSERPHLGSTMAMCKQIVKRQAASNMHQTSVCLAHCQHNAIGMCERSCVHEGCRHYFNTAQATGSFSSFCENATYSDFQSQCDPSTNELVSANTNPPSKMQINTARCASGTCMANNKLHASVHYCKDAMKAFADNEDCPTDMGFPFGSPTNGGVFCTSSFENAYRGYTHYMPMESSSPTGIAVRIADPAAASSDSSSICCLRPPEGMNHCVSDSNYDIYPRCAAKVPDVQLLSLDNVAMDTDGLYRAHGCKGVDDGYPTATAALAAAELGYCNAKSCSAQILTPAWVADASRLTTDTCNESGSYATSARGMGFNCRDPSGTCQLKQLYAGNCDIPQGSRSLMPAIGDVHECVSYSGTGQDGLPSNCWDYTQVPGQKCYKGKTASNCDALGDTKMYLPDQPKDAGSCSGEGGCWDDMFDMCYYGRDHVCNIDPASQTPGVGVLQNGELTLTSKDQCMSHNTDATLINCWSKACSPTDPGQDPGCCYMANTESSCRGKLDQGKCASGRLCTEPSLHICLDSENTSGCADAQVDVAPSCVSAGSDRYFIVGGNRMCSSTSYASRAACEQNLPAASCTPENVPSSGDESNVCCESPPCYFRYPVSDTCGPVQYQPPSAMEIGTEAGKTKDPLAKARTYCTRGMSCAECSSIAGTPLKGVDRISGHSPVVNCPGPGWCLPESTDGNQVQANVEWCKSIQNPTGGASAYAKVPGVAVWCEQLVQKCGSNHCGSGDEPVGSLCASPSGDGAFVCKGMSNYTLGCQNETGCWFPYAYTQDCTEHEKCELEGQVCTQRNYTCRQGTWQASAALVPPPLADCAFLDVESNSGLDHTNVRFECDYPGQTCDTNGNWLCRNEPNIQRNCVSPPCWWSKTAPLTECHPAQSDIPSQYGTRSLPFSDHVSDTQCGGIPYGQSVCHNEGDLCYSLVFGSQVGEGVAGSFLKLSDCSSLDDAAEYLHRCTSVGGQLEYVNTCIPKYPKSVLDVEGTSDDYMYQPCYHIGQKAYTTHQVTGRMDTYTCQYEAVTDWRCLATHDDVVKNAAIARGYDPSALINMGHGCMGDCKPNQVCVDEGTVKICSGGVWDVLASTDFACCVPSASDPSLGVAERGCWVPDSTPRRCSDTQSSESRVCVPSADASASYTCRDGHTHQCLDPPCWTLDPYWSELEDCGQVIADDASCSRLQAGLLKGDQSCQPTDQGRVCMVVDPDDSPSLYTCNQDVWNKMDAPMPCNYVGQRCSIATNATRGDFVCESFPNGTCTNATGSTCFRQVQVTPPTPQTKASYDRNIEAVSKFTEGASCEASEVSKIVRLQNMLLMCDYSNDDGSRTAKWIRVPLSHTLNCPDVPSGNTQSQACASGNECATGEYCTTVASNQKYMVCENGEYVPYLPVYDPRSATWTSDCVQNMHDGLVCDTPGRVAHVYTDGVQLEYQCGPGKALGIGDVQDEGGTAKLVWMQQPPPPVGVCPEYACKYDKHTCTVADGYVCDAPDSGSPGTWTSASAAESQIVKFCPTPSCSGLKEGAICMDRGGSVCKDDINILSGCNESPCWFPINTLCTRMVYYVEDKWKQDDTSRLHPGECVVFPSDMQMGRNVQLTSSYMLTYTGTSSIPYNEAVLDNDTYRMWYTTPGGLSILNSDMWSYMYEYGAGQGGIGMTNIEDAGGEMDVVVGYRPSADMTVPLSVDSVTASYTCPECDGASNCRCLEERAHAEIICAASTECAGFVWSVNQLDNGAFMAQFYGKKPLNDLCLDCQAERDASSRTCEWDVASDWVFKKCAS